MVFSKFFGIDKTPIAGLEIGQDFIVFLKLIKEENGFAVDNLIQIPTPPNAVSGGNINDPEGIGEVVRSILDRNEIETIKVNLSLPSNVPFIRTVTLPDLPYEELKVIAKDEASNHIPFSISDANVDFVLLEESRRVESGNKRIIDVLIVAVPKSVAQKYVDVADAAKIKINTIEVATYSMIKGLANAGQIKPTKDIVVSVLIGFDTTDITLVSNGFPLFSHTAPVGKKNIIDTISTGLGLSQMETLNFIPQVAILVPGFATTNDPQIVKAATLVRMIYNTISTEISKAIQFYQSQKAEPPEILKIVLGGPGMCIKNAEKFIGNRLKIDTELADSFNNINVPPEQLENYDTPTLITSVGLALKGL
ncbi:MAG: type IV pilus assembly protein PilM [Cyanobacteriota bacterium]